MHKILEGIKANKSIALIIHQNPDGDAVGSALAFKDALESLGKSVDIYSEDRPSKIYSFLKGISNINICNDMDKRYDLAIALDCGDISRLGSCRSIFDDAKLTMNIDHHLSNPMYADINFVDIQASATGEIIYRLINELDLKLTKDMAEYLYVGIVTDTGRFSFNNTKGNTHRIIGDLVDLGIDIDKISSALFKQYDKKWIQLLGASLSDISFYFNDRVSIIKIDQKTFKKFDADESYAEGIIQYAKDIEGIEVAILFKEIEKDKIKISFRSSSLVDVSKLASLFGGGGHIRAAGATAELSIDEIQKILLSELNSYFEEE